MEGKIKMNKQQAYIKEIKIIHTVESNPDLSYLEQDYFNANPKYPLCSQKENEKYKAQDKRRIELYNDGYWCSIGIRAEADIYLRIDTKTIQRIGDIKSSGLWGIESDSKEHCIKRIEQEQIKELRELLKAMNVSVPKNVKIVKEEENE